MKYVIALTFLIFFTGCDSNSWNAAAQASPQGKAPVVSDDDARTLKAIKSCTGRWNEAGAPLVREYLDPNVSARQWSKDASAHLSKLRLIFLEMQGHAMNLRNPKIFNMLKDVTASYKAKLDAMTALHFAVTQGDEAGEMQAQKALNEACTNAMDLARKNFLPYVDPESFHDELKSRFN